MLTQLFLIAMMVFAAVVRAEDVDEKDVLVLNKDNFDAALTDNEFILVEFYAPWCGHCKKLTPEYAKAATELKSEGVALAKVDATEEADLAQKFEVRGYPTLKFFRNGSPMDYGGGRTASEIVSWCKKKSGPPTTALDGADAVDAFVKGKAPGAVVGAFKERDSDAHKAFVKTAGDGALDEFAFADYAGGDDTITLYTAHGEPQKFDGEADGLKDWILANGYPLVDELPGCWSRLAARELPLAILFVDPEADSTEVKAAVTAAAEKVSDKMSFSWADGVRFAQQIERMGGKTDKLPTIAAMQLNGKANYPYDGELTADALTAWAEGIVDGSIKPHLKSEPIPEKNDGPVTVVVGKQFNEIALAEDKDVLLEVYAPWCGHCKSLAPIYEELGEFYKDNDKVVISKLDGTANDVVDLDFRGFPTIKFKPAGKSAVADFVDYEGGRTLEDFKSFLAKNAKNAGSDDGDEKTEL